MNESYPSGHENIPLRYLLRKKKKRRKSLFYDPFFIKVHLCACVYVYIHMFV